MLVVYTTGELLAGLQTIIDTEFRLNELVSIRDYMLEKPLHSGYALMVKPQNGIIHPIDWYNVLPPYLLPEETEPTRENLLGLLYAKLGNYEKSYELLAGNQVLLNDVDIINCLQNGIPVSPSRLTTDFTPFEEYRFCHNAAVLHHYAATDDTFDPDKTRYFYREALNAAPNGEYYGFTAKHFATLLVDEGKLDEAEHLLQEAIKLVHSEDAAVELKAALSGNWMKKLVVPYDVALLENLKTNLWEVLQHYQKQERPVEEALVLVDAAQVAHYSESFAEALGYINRAVDLLRREEFPVLLAQAHHRRGMLLYAWAQSGSPQFYKGAMESFQAALKVFTRDETPDVFADIHQYLGVIYSEIPDEVQKKSIWAGVSSASFQQALDFYSKAAFPYEYAMVCANYANALSKYPEAIHSDNLEKALFYYNEALDIRTAEAWPFERAVTLLNYVETCWHLNLAGNGSNLALFENMLSKATEAGTLTNDPNILKEAKQQLKRLNELKVLLEAEKQN